MKFNNDFIKLMKICKNLGMEFISFKNNTLSFSDKTSGISIYTKLPSDIIEMDDMVINLNQFYKLINHKNFNDIKLSTISTKINDFLQIKKGRKISKLVLYDEYVINQKNTNNFNEEYIVNNPIDIDKKDLTECMSDFNSSNFIIELNIKDMNIYSMKFYNEDDINEYSKINYIDEEEFKNIKNENFKSLDFDSKIFKTIKEIDYYELFINKFPSGNDEIYLLCLMFYIDDSPVYIYILENEQNF